MERGRRGRVAPIAEGGAAAGRLPDRVQLRPDFQSLANWDTLDELLEVNGLPRKRKFPKKQRECKGELQFAMAGLAHLAAESAGNMLQQRGLVRVCSHGGVGFECGFGAGRWRQESRLAGRVKGGRRDHAMPENASVRRIESRCVRHCGLRFRFRVAIGAKRFLNR